MNTPISLINKSAAKALLVASMLGGVQSAVAESLSCSVNTDGGKTTVECNYNGKVYTIKGDGTKTFGKCSVTVKGGDLSTECNS